MSLSKSAVNVTEGQLTGLIHKTLSEFEFITYKGIPYAKPPVGELRFAAPVPPEPWDGVRDCTNECNICPQFDRETSQVIGDEDCLYLNVYTPNLSPSDAKLLPVMVFLHGGGFVFGNGTDDCTHGPDFLVEKNVVVVSLNYRLGVFGFLSLDCKDAAGNMGLKDQVQALKWLQQNIQQFNGDPNNVTIFGFSAGAASVEYLLLSPTAKGLFHKAIAHSGSSLLPWAQNNKIKELARKIPELKKEIVSDTELLQYLKSLSANDLCLRSMAVLAADNGKGGLHFGFVPTIEKTGDWEPFINKSTFDALKQGEFNKVPFIAGCCNREGLLMVSHCAPKLEKFMNERDFLPYLPFEFDNTQKVELDKKFRATYLEGEKTYNETDEFAINYFSDLDFNAGVYISTLLIAKHNSPVYFYEFAYDRNLNYLKQKHNINRKGACHGDDGGYLIKCDILKDKSSDTDKLVRNRICQMWTNFAKFGNPTPEVDESFITTRWEPITAPGIACLVIDDKLTMKYEYYTERMQLFTELYENFYKPE